MPMSQGIVKWFHKHKGFGFIEQENGPDVFVYYTAVKPDDVQSLSEGLRVSFEIEQGPKGPIAANVTVT